MICKWEDIVKLTAIARLPRALEVSRILYAALQQADPEQAVLRALRRSGDLLNVGGMDYDLRQFRRVVIVGAGKAAPSMALGAVGALGNHLDSGLLIYKTLGASLAARIPENITLKPGGHPVPDAASLASTQALADTLMDLSADDLVICLISGGGSALMTLPAANVSLADLQTLTQELLACGATIDEMNCVRKHLDQVKGGGLARLAAPARMIALILSDVVGSPLDVIASGPTTADPSTYAQAWGVLEKYHLVEQAPASIRDALQEGLNGERVETVKAGDACLESVQNLVIADNPQAAEAAAQQASREGWNARVLTTSLRGEAREAGELMAQVLRSTALSGYPLARPACLVAGGETTVTLRGGGLGGRNLEAALGAVRTLAGLPDVACLTLATDGEDGPSGAAGAVVTGETLARAEQAGLSVEDFLQRNDSYHFFELLGDLVITGPSGTNVNDLMFLFAF